MSKLFGSPKIVETPAPPAPRDDSVRVGEAVRRRILKRGGRQSTILTAQPGAVTGPAGTPGGGGTPAQPGGGGTTTGGGRGSTLLSAY